MLYVSVYTEQKDVNYFAAFSRTRPLNVELFDFAQASESITLKVKAILFMIRHVHDGLDLRGRWTDYKALQGVTGTETLIQHNSSSHTGFSVRLYLGSSCIRTRTGRLVDELEVQ